MRKTLNVEQFKNKCNQILAESDKNVNEMRVGVIVALEEALRMTGNYQGFQYLEKRQVRDGRPGIRSYDKSHEENFKDTDDTRRRYF